MLLFFVPSALAVSIISQIPNYVISPSEVCDLHLSSYFSGDYLSYTSNSSIQISNSSLKTTSQQLYAFPESFSFEQPYLLQMAEVNEDQVLLVPYKNYIYLFHYNSTWTNFSFAVELPSNNTFVTISQLIQLSINSSIYILINTLQTVGPENYTINELYMLNLSLVIGNDSATNYLQQLNMWDVKYASTFSFAIEENLNIGESDNVVVSMLYYAYDWVIIMVYDFSQPFTPVLAYSIVPEKFPVWVVISQANLYIITLESDVLVVQFTPGAYSYVNSTVIDTYSPIYSASLSNDHNTLLLTTQNAFITLSINPLFSSYYYKEVSNDFEYVHAAEDLGDYYMIMKSDNLTKTTFIFTSKIELDLLYMLTIKGVNLHWFALQVSDTEIDLMFSNSTEVSLIAINLAQAEANITANVQKYVAITAYELTRETSVTQTFTVTSLNSNATGSVFYLGPSRLSYSVNFNQLIGTLDINCNSLFSAQNLTCALSKISFNKNVFEDVNSTFNSAITLVDNWEDPIFADYNNLLVLGNDIFFYNASGGVLVNETFYNKEIEYNWNIEKIYTTGAQFYAIANVSWVIYATDLYFNTDVKVDFYVTVVKLAFLDEYVMVLTEFEFEIYTLFLCNSEISFCKELSFHLHLVDIYGDGSLLLMLFPSYFQICYMNDYSCSKSLEISYSCTFCTNISTSDEYIFIYGPTVMLIFDIIQLSLVKQLNFSTTSLCSVISNNSFFFFDGTFLYFYDLSALAHSALIQYLSLTPYFSASSCVLSIGFVEPASGVLFLLVNTEVLVFAYNTDGFLLTVNGYLFANASSDQQIELVNATLVGFSQQNTLQNSTFHEVQFAFMINGLTMYQNKSTDNETIEFNCEVPSGVSLSSIVTGQNISFQLSKNEPSFGISNRVTDAEWKNNSLGLKHFRVLQNAFEIGLSQNTVYMIEGGNVVGQATLANETFLSLAAITTYQTPIRFLTGSAVNESNFTYWREKNNTVQSSFYRLRLWTFDDGQFFCRYSKLLTSPDRIRVISKLGNEFVAVIFNTIANAEANSNYKNVVSILHYTEKDRKLLIAPLQFSAFDINSIYISDVAGVFDPMFGRFYLYFADINAGIRSFSFNDTIMDMEYLGLISTAESIVGLALSSSFLYASGESSTLYYYELIDFDNLQLENTVFYISQEFRALYGTLCMSDTLSPVYLAQLITTNSQTNNGDIYLQVVDVLVPGFSAILAEKNTNFKANDQVSIQILPSKKILLLTNDSFIIYNISQGLLVFEGMEKCRNEEIELQIVANGTYSSTSFILIAKIIGHYSSGSISHGGVSVYEILLTIMGGIVLIIILPFLAKCCARRCQKKVQQESFFEYDFRQFEFDR
jgi:hypothetical protein